MDYGFKKETALEFSDAVEKTKEALKHEGFGILCEIDVRKTLKEKTGTDIEDYIILGACNPGYALKAMEKEKDIGLLLPCNAIIYRRDGKTIIGVVSPSKMLEVTGNAELKEIAEEVEKKMKSALEKIR